jgi:hypothetical protein
MRGNKRGGGKREQTEAEGMNKNLGNIAGNIE